MEKKFLITAAIILCCPAIALRIVTFHTNINTIPAFDDECITALQSMQIAEGKFSLLFLGQPYMFPLEAYLMAPFIHFLPRDAFGARIMAFGFGILTVIISLFILRRQGAWKETWPGLALILIPSSFLMIMQSGYALPSYPTLILACVLIVWIAQLHHEAHKNQWLLALLGGCAGGLAVSGTFLALPLLIMGGMMIGAFRNWKLSAISTVLFGLGAAIGLLPHLAANYLYGNPSHAVTQSIPLKAAMEKFVDVILDNALPAAFGCPPQILPGHNERIAATGLDFHIGVIFILILAIATGFSLKHFICRWRKERWPQVDTSLAFAGISWLSLIFFMFSNRSESTTPRYLLPMIISFPFLMAFTYQHSGRIGRLIISTITILLLAINITTSVKVMQRWKSPGFADFLKSYDLTPTLQYLDQNGINRCYATYPDAYRITFNTDKRIICAQPYNERFPNWPVPFKNLVDSATNVAYVLSDAYKFPPTQFEAELAAMQIKCRKETRGHYEIYTDFKSATMPPHSEIPSTALSITTSHNQKGAPAMHDGNHDRNWRSLKAQEKGMTVDINISSARTISGIALHYNAYRHDQASAINIKTHDGHNWTSLTNNVAASLDNFEFVNGHPVFGSALQTIRFPAVTTDKLRLEIAEEEPNRDWTIGEIRLFEP